MDFKHHFADLGEVTIHYVTAGADPGDRPPIVLLHGWPQTWYEWRDVIPLLAAHHPVIAPDLRGLGDSSRPLDGYDKRTVAQDIFRLLAEHLGLERWHCVGHDWGGPVTYALGARHPESMLTMTIIDVVIPGAGDFSQGGRRWHHGFHLTPDLPEALVTGRERAYLGWFYREFSWRRDAIDAARPSRSTCAPTPSRARCAPDSRTTATGPGTPRTTRRCLPPGSGFPCRCSPWAAGRPRPEGAQPSRRNRCGGSHTT